MSEECQSAQTRLLNLIGFPAPFKAGSGDQAIACRLHVLLSGATGLKTDTQSQVELGNNPQQFADDDHDEHQRKHDALAIPILKEYRRRWSYVGNRSLARRRQQP